jgi:hypothetical protein
LTALVRKNIAPWHAVEEQAEHDHEADARGELERDSERDPQRVDLADRAQLGSQCRHRKQQRDAQRHQESCGGDTPSDARSALAVIGWSASRPCVGWWVATDSRGR